MRVAAVQFKATKGDRADSERRLHALLSELQGPQDLVVLPEMALTGYLFADAAHAGRVAEPAHGPTLTLLGPHAQRLGAWLVCGFPERDGDRLFNSALIVAPDGRLDHVYRKTLLYDADTPWAQPGDTPYRVIPTAAGSFAVGICMDINDERFVTWLRSARPRALAFPTNWIDEGLDIWGYWATRMASTGAALIAADTWGDEHLHGETTGFWGRSAIIDAPTRRRRHATLLAAAPDRGDGIIAATLPATA